METHPKSKSYETLDFFCWLFQSLTSEFDPTVSELKIENLLLGSLIEHCQNWKSPDSDSWDTVPPSWASSGRWEEQRNVKSPWFSNNLICHVSQTQFCHFSINPNVISASTRLSFQQQAKCHFRRQYVFSRRPLVGRSLCPDDRRCCLGKHGRALDCHS